VEHEARWGAGIQGSRNALLNAGEPLVVERRGRAVGACLPFQAVDKAVAAATDLAATLAAIRERTGLGEDELVAAFLREA
jgi:hypothetical protein